MATDSFLDIDNINEDNRERLIRIRENLAADVARNAREEDTKGMYLISLVIFTEFERLTRHITDSKIVKS